MHSITSYECHAYSINSSVCPCLLHILLEGADNKDTRQLSCDSRKSGKPFAFFFHHFRALKSGSRAGSFRKCSSLSLLVLMDYFSERVPRRNCIALSYGSCSSGSPSATIESFPLLSPSILRFHLSSELLTCYLSLFCAEESQVSMSEINTGTENRQVLYCMKTRGGKVLLKFSSNSSFETLDSWQITSLHQPNG